MKRYLFTVWYNENGMQHNPSHEEMFRCDADAMVRARAILNDTKRDVNAFQIDLYGKRGNDWKHIVSYQ